MLKTLKFDLVYLWETLLLKFMRKWVFIQETLL